MDVLLNPNIAYLLLVAGTLLSILALLSPGTGVLEIGALFILLIAGWEAYNLPLNFWALMILLLGVIPFVIAVRKSKQPIYLILAIAAFLIGSIFLFHGETLWQPAVNPLLALFVSILATGFLWLIATKVIEAEQSRPSHDMEALIGQRGEIKSIMDDEYSVQVAGELWTARNNRLGDRSLNEGDEITVTGREGFILLVERLPESGDN